MAPPPNIVEDEARPIVEWRSDGRAFVAGRGDKVAIIAVPGGAPTPVEGVGGKVVAVRFSPRGDRLAVVTEALDVKIHDGKTGALVAKLEDKVPEDEVNAIVFSPDSKLLAASGRTTARVWSLETKAKLCDTRDAYAFDLAFTPDQGSLVATGVGAITRWEIASCEQKAQNGADTGGTFGSWVAADGLHVAGAGASGHELQLFGGRDLHKIDTVAKSFGCSDHVAATFSRDGKVLLAYGGVMWTRSIRLDSMKSISAYDIPRPEEVSYALQFDDGERVLVARGDKAEIVNAKDKVVAFSFGLEGAESIALSWDNKRLLGAAKDKAHVWDTSTGKLLETITLP